jgi:hypothetical protein
MLCCASADAQYRRRYKIYEVHGGIGAANAFGDLGGAAVRDNWYGLKDIQLSQTRFVFYAGGRMLINERFAVKLNLFGGMTSGKDAGSINDVRNYSYSSIILEGSGQLEWNFLWIHHSIGSSLLQRRGLRGSQMMTRFYLFGGIGAVYSRPELHTNGRDLISQEYTKRSTLGLTIPYGLGVTSDISPYWAVGLEMGRRNTTTDYIDGFSSEWSKSNDTYYFTTLHAIYKIQFIGGRRKPVRPGSRR